MERERSAGGRRGAALAVGMLGGAAAGSGVALALATYVVRRLVTPERDRTDNVQILAVDPGSSDRTGTITLARTLDTEAPGRYGIWLNGGRGHARVGEVLAEDPVTGAVTRRLEGVDAGTLRPGPGRWNGYYYGGDPRQSLGLDFTQEQIDGPVGALPAWRIPGAGGADRGPGESSGRWAILVHGRGALRGECLRAVPVLHRLGFTSLVLGYRNDEDGPSSGDRRYALGLAEWADVEAALRWAGERGARSVALFGWSMGGAIVLQTLSRSALADELVDRVVLDAPVVDWGDVLRHHVRLGRIPGGVARLGAGLLRSASARHLVGIDSPLDVAETNWPARAAELRHPTLLIHSVDDEFVPVGPSVALARARADVVRYVRWTVARHTREWNTDPARWDRVVSEFLTDTA